MTRNTKILWLGGGIIFIVLAIHYWNYDAKVAERQQADIVSEMADVSPQAPISLIQEPADGIAPILTAIEHAKYSIDIVMYEFQDTQIESALANAEQRGVSVRVILNQGYMGKQENQAAHDYFAAHGVAVEWSPGYFPITHQKSLVVDNQEAFILTFNVTPRYYASARDFGIVDTNTADVTAIESAFESDWQGTETPASPASDLLWSPGSADALLVLINTASTSLDIYNEEMADPRIMAALENAESRGVSVNIIMTYATTWKSAFDNLTAHGVGVETYASTAKTYIHAKIIIADNKLAFLGSENFSAQSLDDNRELGIFTDKPEIINSLASAFNTDWAHARPYGNSGSATQSSSTASASTEIIKLSTSGVCHDSSDTYYTKTTHFIPYATMQDCLNAGGRALAK